MVLVVGGKGQGKLAYAKKAFGLLDGEIWDGETCCFDLPPGGRGLNRLPLLVKRLLEAGLDPMEWARSCLKAHPELIVLSDEVGCGVVPLSPEERAWREATGRICCYFAQESTEVVRLCCGIPQPLKLRQEEKTKCS